MANMMDNYGLEFLVDNEESAMNFIRFITGEGKAITGYYGIPYLFTPMGDSEFWVNIEKNTDGENCVTGFDSHCSNRCVWELVHSGIDITPEDSSKLKRTIMFNNSGGEGGLLPVEVITADVLPSLMKGDKVKMQVVAMPLEINYYKDEEEYAKTLPEDKNGKKWAVGMGSLIPLSFLHNHSTDVYEQGMDYESDCYVTFCATVKKLYHGFFKANGEKHKTFIRCAVDTMYGELEFVHTFEQVPEDQRDNIEVGAIVSGVCIISGDVAIYEYEEGLVRDFEHNLSLLRYTLVEGDPDRLVSSLAENAVFYTDTKKTQYTGAKEIVDRINTIHKNREEKYLSYYATITSVNNDCDEYPVGTKCIVLAEEKDKYESIVFMTVDEDGLISKIKVSLDDSYSFKVDVPEKEYSPLDDIEFPESVFEPIVNRAKFHGIIDNDIDAQELIKNIDVYNVFEENVLIMLEALKKNPQPDVEKTFERILGYLFAKSIEMAVNTDKDRVNGTFEFAVLITPEDAFEGIISSSLSEESHKVLEKAMELGYQFYNDFKLFVLANEPNENEFVELFTQTAVTVQQLGKMYSKRCFKEK